MIYYTFLFLNGINLILTESFYTAQSSLLVFYEISMYVLLN